MAKHVLRNAWVSVNSIDLSDHVAEVEVPLSQADVDVTAMGDAGVTRIPGLRDDSITLSLWQDFDASEVDATLWPLFDGGSAFVVEIAADGSVISATNPKYSGTCIMTEYPPIAGAVGDGHQTSVTLPVSGVVSRSTS